MALCTGDPEACGIKNVPETYDLSWGWLLRLELKPRTESTSASTPALLDPLRSLRQRASSNPFLLHRHLHDL
jgi:hypothetical protein